MIPSVRFVYAPVILLFLRQEHGQKRYIIADISLNDTTLNEVPRNKLQGTSLLEYQTGTNHNKFFPPSKVKVVISTGTVQSRP
jgi:hypothetical protein